MWELVQDTYLARSEAANPILFKILKSKRKFKIFRRMAIKFPAILYNAIVHAVLFHETIPLIKNKSTDLLMLVSCSACTAPALASKHIIQN
jgi:hypothetical protein